MKSFKTGISKLLLASLVIVGFSGSLMAQNECNSLVYHTKKGEINLDAPIYNELTNYSAEVFVSKHIYNIDEIRDLNEEFKFGSTNKAKLIKYKNDDSSGFTAGVYLINDKNIVVAFGGTTANEKYSNAGSILNDVKDDLKLLNNNGESHQTAKSRIFMDEVLILLSNMSITNDKVTITGHSLGGGLAQYASMYAGFKGITFNTAPNPLTYESTNKLKDSSGNFISDGSNIINFMTNKDELTLTLKRLESYAKFDILVPTGNDIIDNLITQPVIKNLQVLLNRPTEGLKKLIYGSRIVLNTNTGHSMDTLIQNSYSNTNNYYTFTDSNFIDVSENSELSCALLVSLENHAVSYPNSNREYKFYPNLETNWNEVSVMVVNTFLYEEFRYAESKNSNLTRIEYLNNFNENGVVIQENSVVKVEELNEILREVYKYRILSTITSEKLTETYLSLLNTWDKYSLGLGRVKGLNNTDILTRGEAAIIIYKTAKQDWDSHIKDEWAKQKTYIEGKGVINGFKRLKQLDNEDLYRHNKSISAVRG